MTKEITMTFPIDKTLKKRFKKKTDENGLKIKYVMHRLISDYADGKCIIQ